MVRKKVVTIDRESGVGPRKDLPTAGEAFGRLVAILDPLDARKRQALIRSLVAFYNDDPNY